MKVIKLIKFLCKSGNICELMYTKMEEEMGIPPIIDCSTHRMCVGGCNQ